MRMDLISHESGFVARTFIGQEDNNEDQSGQRKIRCSLSVLGKSVLCWSRKAGYRRRQTFPTHQETKLAPVLLQARLDSSGMMRPVAHDTADPFNHDDKPHQPLKH